MQITVVNHTHTISQLGAHGKIRHFFIAISRNTGLRVKISNRRPSTRTRIMRFPSRIRSISQVNVTKRNICVTTKQARHIVPTGRLYAEGWFFRGDPTDKDCLATRKGILKESVQGVQAGKLVHVIKMILFIKGSLAMLLSVGRGQRSQQQQATGHGWHAAVVPLLSSSSLAHYYSSLQLASRSSSVFGHRRANDIPYPIYYYYYIGCLLRLCVVRVKNSYSKFQRSNGMKIYLLTCVPLVAVHSYVEWTKSSPHQKPEPNIFNNNRKWHKTYTFHHDNGEGTTTAAAKIPFLVSMHRTTSSNNLELQWICVMVFECEWENGNQKTTRRMRISSLSK